MNEPISDALFGVDGTQLPEPLDDPLTGHARDTRWAALELPPISLPPLPDASMLREAIAAALGEDPTGRVDQDPAAAPPSQAARPVPPAAQPAGPPVPQPGPPAPAVPAPPAVPSQGAPLQGGPLQGGPLQGGPPATGAAPRRPSRPSRPFVPVPGSPAQSQSRRPAGWRFRPPLATAFRESAPLGDFRRRIGRERPLVRRTPRHGVGIPALFVIISTVIIFVVLLYNVATGIMETLSHLVP